MLIGDALLNKTSLAHHFLLKCPGQSMRWGYWCLSSFSAICHLYRDNQTCFERNARLAPGILMMGA
jgi:hypothetical protein